MIGSGAAGSVMAFELARRGLDVDRASRPARARTRRPSSTTSSTMFVRAYKQGGLQTTTDHDIADRAGPDRRRLDRHQQRDLAARGPRPHASRAGRAAGAHVPRDALEHAYDELERALHVTDAPQKIANRGASVFLDGCDARRHPGRAPANTTATTASAAAGATTAAATTARRRCSSPTSRGPRRAEPRSSTAASDVAWSRATAARTRRAVHARRARQIDRRRPRRGLRRARSARARSCSQRHRPRRARRQAGCTCSAACS